MLKFFKFQLFIVIFFCLFTQIFAQNQTAADFFEQGMRLVREQKYEQALEAFRQSAKLDPNLSEAHANSGTALMVLKRPAEAAAAFREAVRLALTNAVYRLGFCQSLISASQKTEAVTECKEAMRLDENSAQARLALIIAWRVAGRPNEDVLNLIVAALEKFADDEKLLNTAVEFYVENENYQQALIYAEKLTQVKPNSGFYQAKLADIYLHLERDSEAIAAANKAIQLEPKNVLAHYFFGRVYFELAQYEEAANAFQKATQLDANLIDAFYYFGVSEARRGKSYNAITALRKAVSFSPDNFSYQMQLADVLTDEGKYEEAIVPSRKAVSLKPRDFRAKVGLGLALFESTKYEEALTILMEADKMQPGNDIVQMFLSVTRTRQQGVAQIEQMKEYAKENPQNVGIRVSLIQMLGYSRRMSEAAPYLEEFYKLKPKEVRAYSSIAAVYLTVADFDKAAEIYRKSLEVEENYGTYFGLASIYSKKGQVEEAIKAYKRVLELKPDVPNMIQIYANFLRDNNRKREALEMYKRSLSMLPLNAPVLFEAAVLSAKFGDKDTARQYLATLKSLDPQLARSLERFLRLKN